MRSAAFATVITNLVAALCELDWQRWNRTSFNPLVKAYLPDISANAAWGGAIEQDQSEAASFAKQGTSLGFARWKLG